MLNPTRAQRMSYARTYAKSDNAFVRALNKFINGRPAYVIVSKESGERLTRAFTDDSRELMYGHIEELYICGKGAAKN